MCGIYIIVQAVLMCQVFTLLLELSGCVWYLPFCSGSLDVCGIYLIVQAVLMCQVFTLLLEQS